MIEELDEAAQADLNRALEPGEQILWSARHDWRSTLRRGVRWLAWALAVFGVFGGTLAAAFSSAKHDASLAWVIAAVFGGSYLLVAAVLLPACYWTRRRLYAVTDR